MYEFIQIPRVEISIRTDFNIDLLTCDENKFIGIKEIVKIKYKYIYVKQKKKLSRKRY